MVFEGSIVGLDMEFEMWISRVWDFGLFVLVFWEMGWYLGVGFLGLRAWVGIWFMALLGMRGMAVWRDGGIICFDEGLMRMCRI